MCSLLVLIVITSSAYGAGLDITEQIDEAISDDNVETLQSIISQAQINPGTFSDAEGNTLLHKAFSREAMQIAAFLFQHAQDPVALLGARNKKGLIPLNFLNPTSDLFRYFLGLAYVPIDCLNDSAARHYMNFSRFTEQTLINKWLNAAEIGNIQKIKKMLNSGIINMQDHNGYTALVLAASQGHENIVELLLQHPNINVNAQSSSGDTALMQSVWYGFTTIAKRLSEHPAINVNLQDDLGRNALMSAAERGHIKNIRFLLQIPNITINHQDKYGETALMKALRDDNTFKLFLNTPRLDFNLQNSHGKTVLIMASEQGRINIVRILLARPGININAQTKEGKTALIYAQDHNRHDCVKLLQDKIATLTAQAFESIVQNNKELLKSIIAQIGVNIFDKEGDTLLHKAIKQKKLEIAKLLLLADSVCLEINNADCNDAIELAVGYPESFELIKTMVPEKTEISKARQTPNGDLLANTCAQCFAHNCTQICSGCKKIYYCSIECQKKHWQSHKLDCKLH